MNILGHFTVALSFVSHETQYSDTDFSVCLFSLNISMLDWKDMVVLSSLLSNVEPLYCMEAWKASL